MNLEDLNNIDQSQGSINFKTGVTKLLIQHEFNKKKKPCQNARMKRNF